VDDVLRDLRYGARMLRRQPGTSLIIILTLALGIGANTAIFSLVETIFLRPLPVSAPDRLVLFSDDASMGTTSSKTPPEGVWTLFSSEAYESLRRAPLPFASVAAFSGSGNDSVGVRLLDRRAAGDAATAVDVRARAHLVSGNYFDVMGVAAALGRALRPYDDQPSAPPVTVVSDDFWRHALHADPGVVGSGVEVNRVAFTVVGVLPASFFGERVRSAPDLWVPLVRQAGIQGGESLLERPDHYWLSLIGRLGPGQSLEAAQSAVTLALRAFLAAKAGSPIDEAARQRIGGVKVVMASGARGISAVRQDDAQALTLLVAAVGLVLLMACANVATLLLCRATARRTELAVRRALGASRARLVRQWLTESVLLATTGAALGVLSAYVVAPWLLSFFPAGPLTTTLNTRVLLVTIGITGLASFIFGLAPALRAGAVDALASLRSSGRGTQARYRAFGATEPFVIAQIAVSLVLATGAVLFARSLLNLEGVPLGFDQDQLLLIKIDPREAGDAPSDVGPLYRRLYDQVAAVPGVQSVTFARYSPFGGSLSSFGATVDGYSPAAGERIQLEAVEVGPKYPQTLGMPLAAGRAIGLEDTTGTAPVAMVNEAFVRRFFATSSPLGHHLGLSNNQYEIVGVLKDALFHSARDQMVPFVFVPMLQQTGQMALSCEIELRTRADVNADALAPIVRRVISTTDSRIVATRTRTLRAQVLATFGPERLAAGFVGAFAVLALLLAAVGLYGVVSHGVARRTKELGVRIALGAALGDIVWLVLRDTLVWLAIGTAVGAGASAAAGRRVASQLFGVSAADPVSFLIATAILAGVALAASLIPAFRARHVDPVAALRAE
jgi:macrolide transport system ATP-binding/permease protein